MRTWFRLEIILIGSKTKKVSFGNGNLGLEEGSGVCSLHYKCQEGFSRIRKCDQAGALFESQ
ncbi:hypothetical protein BGP76_07555 [Reichenbachiella sp. MSK19-1]|nr:hypothetical protein BGP76_07555 [Reichenbachiella sp. MSK19-1]